MQWRGLEKCMRGQSHKFLQGRLKDIGDDISSCGSITPSLKKSRRRYVTCHYNKRLIMILKFSWVFSVTRIMTVQDKYTNCNSSRTSQAVHVCKALDNVRKVRASSDGSPCCEEIAWCCDWNVPEGKAIQGVYPTRAGREYCPSWPRSFCLDVHYLITTQLREFDRVRKLYEKYIEVNKF